MLRYRLAQVQALLRYRLCPDTDIAQVQAFLRYRLSQVQALLRCRLYLGTLLRYRVKPCYITLYSGVGFNQVQVFSDTDFTQVKPLLRYRI